MSNVEKGSQAGTVIKITAYYVQDVRTNGSISKKRAKTSPHEPLALCFRDDTGGMEEFFLGGLELGSTYM